MNQNKFSTDELKKIKINQPQDNTKVPEESNEMDILTQRHGITMTQYSNPKFKEYKDPNINSSKGITSSQNQAHIRRNSLNEFPFTEHAAELNFVVKSQKFKSRSGTSSPACTLSRRKTMSDSNPMININSDNQISSYSQETIVPDQTR